MTIREQLIQEIAQAPDFLVEEVLDFMLFAKARRSQQALSETKKELRPFALCAGEFTVPPDFNDQLPIDVEVEIEVHNNNLIVRAAPQSRLGWDEAFAGMAQRHDDVLLDDGSMTLWDQTEW